MPSFSFWVFDVLDFTQKKQLYFLVQGPIGPIWGFGGNNSSKKLQTELSFWPQVALIVVPMSFETFLQRQDVPNVWVFCPTLTPIYPLMMVEIKSSLRAIQISQNQGPIYFQFLSKTIVTLCSILPFFR